MNKFKNFIYLTICEETLPLFKETNYLSYRSYCQGMAISLKSGDKLSPREKHHFLTISNALEKIYNLNDNEMAEYIVDYFNCDKFEDYEYLIKLTNELYPHRGI